VRPDLIYDQRRFRGTAGKTNNYIPFTLLAVRTSNISFEKVVELYNYYIAGIFISRILVFFNYYLVNRLRLANLLRAYQLKKLLRQLSQREREARKNMEILKKSYITYYVKNILGIRSRYPTDIPS